MNAKTLKAVKTTIEFVKDCKNNKDYPCHSCHTKTNGKKKRLFWTEFYQNIINVRGLI